MNRYRQLTSGERYALSALRKQGCNQAAIARALGRHRSTISREVRRNSKDRQGRAYRPDLAMTTPGGDEADRAAMSASVHRTGEWWRRASGNSGALSKPQAGYGARLGSRSATRPSTAISGATESAVATCICICAVRPSNAENGTDPMIPEVGWPANGRYLSAQLAHRTEAESATSKPIP